MFGKRLAEQVQKLMTEYHYKPWEIKRLTLGDIRRMLGQITPPTRRLKKYAQL